MGSVRTIVSGGQAGTDRATLDFARERAIPRGVWCPRAMLAVIAQSVRPEGDAQRRLLSAARMEQRRQRRKGRFFHPSRMGAHKTGGLGQKGPYDETND